MRSKADIEKAFKECCVIGNEIVNGGNGLKFYIAVKHPRKLLKMLGLK